ncbi:MAG: hypothetical protein AAFP00_16675 [Bacteroidota bacterium]
MEIERKVAPEGARARSFTDSPYAASLNVPIAMSASETSLRSPHYAEIPGQAQKDNATCVRGVTNTEEAVLYYTR